MHAEPVEIPQEVTTKRHRGHWLEFLLLGVLGLIAAIVTFQHTIFARDILISPADASQFSFHGYTDVSNRGGSIFRAHRKPLRWSCDLRPGFSVPYCAYEIILDHDGAIAGPDLRTLESLVITLDYKGPPTTVRVHLKNEDPHYSKHHDRSTAKANTAEFSLKSGRQTMVLRPQDFSVAGWWLAQRQLPPELSRTQLDDVVALEFMTGSNAANAHYDFAVEAVRINRLTVNPATLYLSILVSLAILIALYVLVRIRWARSDRAAQDRIDGATRAVLAEAKLVAEKANRAKSDFLASMSHELRTPLNAILGYSQLLERGTLTDKQRNAIGVIHRSGDHLLNLIVETLDLAKIEAGKMELNETPCDLRASVAAVGEMVRLRAEDKGIAFSCEIARDVPQSLLADEKRLRQVLLNLLGNAVKFTTEGGVSLSVTLIKRDATTARLAFVIEDTGPGMSPEELERIFVPFEQAGDAGAREGGTGLGLAICGQLVSLMGSTIQVQSRVGSGSRFWFEADFTLDESDQAAGSAYPSSSRQRNGPRARILIVDDVADNRNFLRELLCEAGFECLEAENGLRALEAAEQDPPDLVLMDLEMPVMNGCEATRRMRMMEALKSVPIIIVSANLSEEAITVSSAAGACGFISKPVDGAVLLQAVEGLCRPRQPIAALPG